MSKGRYGEYGGQYISETLMNELIYLEEQYNHYMSDPGFVEELDMLLKEYAGRPSLLYYAERMTKDLGGAKIYLKREDLNHTGAHKINNVLGQVLLAKKMGKTRVIAENTQVDKVGLLKYQASAAVKEYTGLNLNEMRQEGSEYFTPEGKSIRDIVKEALEKNVGEKHRSEANSYLSYLLDEVGKINWKNSPNMVLGILYSQKGLKDIGQELVFDGYSQIGGNKWYSVL